MKAKGQITANHINRMFKRRLKNEGISTHYSCHSFRVTVITDLLKQGIEMSDVRNMVGHSDSRTTELYDRREHEVTQNLVERISI